MYDGGEIMDLVYLFPIVIPVTIITPLLIFAMLFKAAKKRVCGEHYIKEMAFTTMISVFYVLFLSTFYL